MNYFNTEKTIELKKYINNIGFNLDLAITLNNNVVVNRFIIFEKHDSKEMNIIEIVNIFKKINIEPQKVLDIINKLINTYGFKKFPNMIGVDINNEKMKLYFNEFIKMEGVVFDVENYFCSGFTIDLKTNKILSEKIYIKILELSNTSPYILMFNKTNQYDIKKYFYVLNKNKIDFFHFLRKDLNINYKNYLSNLPLDYEISEVQHSNEDSKINLYFFDKFIN